MELERLLKSLGRMSADLQPAQVLSPREMEVFSWMGRGLTNECIAAEMALSRQTVETHRKSVSQKVRASGAQLLRHAVLYVVSHADD